MTQILETKLIQIASYLTGFLEKESIREFYIGKTENLGRRKEEHYSRDNLRFTKPIAEGNSDIVDKAEKYLIDYFTDHPVNAFLINKADTGGEGNPNASILYISFNQKITDTSDPLDDEDCFIIEGIETPIKL